MTDRASSLSRLVLTVFRLNGGLLEAGDALVRDIGLTSARWQVLGALAEHGAPRTVSQIARTMGLTRQSVQRLADDLRHAVLIEFLPNPDHARAKLMTMTRDRKSVVEGKSVSVRVDLGGRRIIKKKKKNNKKPIQ